MVLLMSVFLFVAVMSLMYFFGMKFWVNPKTMLERVTADGLGQQSTHSSLAFHELLAKVGNLVPASPVDLTKAEKRLYSAGYRSSSALKIFYGTKAVGTLLLPLLTWTDGAGRSWRRESFRTRRSGGRFGVSRPQRIRQPHGEAPQAPH